MNKSVVGVKTLTDLLDENDDLTVFIDKCNCALAKINGAASMSVVIASEVLDLDQFDQVHTRRFIVGLKNEATEVQEGYTAKIKQLTGLLNE